jgi:hypothetical protein
MSSRDDRLQPSSGGGHRGMALGSGGGRVVDGPVGVEGTLVASNGPESTIRRVGECLEHAISVGHGCNM